MKPTSLVFAFLLAGALVVLRGRLSRSHLALGVLVTAWLVVHGTGLVHLPDFERTAKEIGPDLGAWAYLLVGSMAFLETAFFVGLIAPGEFAVVLGGFIAGQGEIDVAVLGATVSGCAAAGDTTSYLIGRRLGRGFLLAHGRRFGLSTELLDRVEGFFEAHGAKTILLGRFVGLVRAVTPFTAGASRVPARRFLPVDYLAAILWSVTFVSLGYVFWRSFDTAIAIAKRGTLVLGVLAAVAVAAVAGFRWLERPGSRDRLRAAWRTRSLQPLRGKLEPESPADP